jgi:hypothetical protein
MAIAIKSIPILKKQAAKYFVEKAEDSFNHKGTVDFTEQLASANRILEKAKMK